MLWVAIIFAGVSLAIAVWVLWVLATTLPPEDDEDSYLEGDSHLAEIVQAGSGYGPLTS